VSTDAAAACVWYGFFQMLDTLLAASGQDVGLLELPVKRMVDR
jgi:hypothetical protein